MHVEVLILFVDLKKISNELNYSISFLDNPYYKKQINSGLINPTLYMV